MNKITLYLILVWVGMGNLFSQNPITYNDDFLNRQHGWIIENSADSGKILDRNWILTNKNPKSSLKAVKKFDFDPGSDYTFKARIKMVRGAGKAEFGLFISDTPKPNYTDWHNFLISGDQLYHIFYEGYKSRAPMDYKALTKARNIIKPRGQYNEISIQKKGDLLYFIINGKEVHVESDNLIRGKTLGINVKGFAEIAVDYVSLTGMKKINLVEGADQGFKKIKLSSAVNTDYSDLLPIISYDGKTLYFVRKEDPENVTPGDDIWYSTLNSQGLWTEAKHMETPLNNSGSNFVISATPDGNTLLLGNSYHKDGSPKEGGISLTHRIKGGWSMPENVEIINDYNNSVYVNYALSADRKVLISAVERNETEGGNDMYVSFLTDSGTYSEPLNMGPVLNTEGYDGTPFIAADNKTLYFSSSGHTGYGKNDIFLSRRLDDSWTNWSEPENLGPDINSSGWDAYYALPAKGDYAFLVSDNDIYTMKVTEAARPEPVVLVYGKLVDQDKEPVLARITYYDEETDEEVGSANTSPDDGSYKMVLSYGKKYRYTAEGETFDPITKRIDASDINTYEEVESNLKLKTTKPIALGSPRGGTPKDLNLNSVLFEFNKSFLTPKAQDKLDGVISKLRANSELKVEIQGHTDNIGSNGYNERLARARIRSVRNYLTYHGIADDRLVNKGFGERDPVADNDTEEGREKNRRVEFKIIE